MERRIGYQYNVTREKEAVLHAKHFVVEQNTRKTEENDLKMMMRHDDWIDDEYCIVTRVVVLGGRYFDLAGYDNVGPPCY